MTTPLPVHIWSDIACPWCFLGKRRFERAAQAFEGELEVEYHSFELSPDTPVDFDGGEADFLAGYKGMPREHAVRMLAEMTELAAAEGLKYDFAALRHTNTLLAHQAIHHAKAQGRQEALVERLFHAYFEQGLHVGRVDDLADLAAEVGLDRAGTRQALVEGAYAGAVAEDIATARQVGINGVPFYIIGRYAVSGAQSSELFGTALRRAAADAAGAEDDAEAGAAAVDEAAGAAADGEATSH